MIASLVTFAYDVNLPKIVYTNMEVTRTFQIPIPLLVGTGTRQFIMSPHNAFYMDRKLRIV
jgi:hypothetical protein